jgi:hypothetical protein
MELHPPENFDVLIEATGIGYRAGVRGLPTGEFLSGPVTIPFTRSELSDLRLPARPSLPGRLSPGGDAICAIGERLFDDVFRDDLRLAWRASMARTEALGIRLRLRLLLPDSPELADLPWELLHDTETHRYLALSRSSPVVRFVDLPDRSRPLAIDPPLRVLALIASPSDVEPVDVDSEWAKIRSAFAVDAMDSPGWMRGLSVDRVPTGTLADLRARLRREEYHVLHFVGHGHHDKYSMDDVLAFEGPDGLSEQVTGSDLGALLHHHRTIRLVVLDSGAVRLRRDSFAGTARSLVQQGIPAVVATQFAMSDRAAISFLDTLYRGVAQEPLDTAVTAGRNRVRDEQNAVDWAAPALYLGTSDARVLWFTPMVMGGSRRDPDPSRPPLEAPSAPRIPESPRMPPPAASAPPSSTRDRVAGPRFPRLGGRRRGRPAPDESALAQEDPYTAEAIEKAVQRVLTPGRILFNPPDDMRQGTVERIEVAIARTAGLDSALRASLRGRGVARIENVATSPFMAVDLRGTGFEITPLSLPPGTEQLLHPTARWEFDVLPRRSGTRTLQVMAWMRVPLPGRPDERVSVPVLERTVQVRVAPLYATKTFAAKNWQWLVATSVAMGGGLTAWLNLVR